MKSIIKLLIFSIICGLLFTLICAGTEYLMLLIWKVEESFLVIYKNGLLRNIIMYIFISSVTFIINYINNYIIVKKLNKSLKIFKESERSKNE